MNVLVSGSHGMVGSALVRELAASGHRVVRLVRGSAKEEPSEVRWDPAAGRLEASALPALDAVVHLAGENLAAGRWTVARKARIRDSRVQGTGVLAEGLARLEKPPRVFLSASAVGYYGDRGDEVLTEESAPGSGFLAEVCRDWEAATCRAADAGIRVVTLRFGMILDRQGGALGKMLGPFRWGLGGRVGSGRQYWSWIALADALAAILHLLASDKLHGPVNLVSPQPVTNREFTRTLAAVLRRPAVFPAPAPLLRLALGEMADQALLASARVQPEKLLSTGFRFRFSDLTSALQAGV